MKKETSERLREGMEYRGFRAVDLVERAKPLKEKMGITLTKSNISQYLSGRSLPNQNKLLILSRILNVNPAWLMGYNVPMEEEKEELTINERESLSHKSIDLQALFQSGAEIRFSSYVLTKKQVRQLRRVLYAVFADELPIAQEKNWDLA